MSEELSARQIPTAAALGRLRRAIAESKELGGGGFVRWQEHARGALHAVVGPDSQYLERFDQRDSAYSDIDERVQRLEAVLQAALAESEALAATAPPPDAPGNQQYSVNYLDRLVDAVQDFSDAFDAWMETQVELDHVEARGLLPTAWTRDGADPAVVKSLELAVAEAAGRAAKSVGITGSYVVVQGNTGMIDPIANWSIVTHPKALLSPADVRLVTAQIRGRLRGMELDARANDHDSLPAFGPTSLHPLIWSAAAPYWTAHQYRVAVREAAEALTIHWKTKLDRTKDTDAARFWGETLKPALPTASTPRLAWPENQEHSESRSFQQGIQHLSLGLNLVVRNVRTHVLTEITEQQALEELGAYSMFARLLECCEIQTSDADEL